MQMFKAVSMGLALSIAVGASVAAQSKAADEKAIIANEQKVLDAITKGDVGAFKALVANDAWSVDAGGPMAATEFEKNFKQIKMEPGSKMTETRVVWAASNTAVLIYRWTGKGTFMGQPVPPVVFASTVWHK